VVELIKTLAPDRQEVPSSNPD